jgi:hypothetical protein
VLLATFASENSSVIDLGLRENSDEAEVAPIYLAERYWTSYRSIDRNRDEERTHNRSGGLLPG